MTSEERIKELERENEVLKEEIERRNARIRIYKSALDFKASIDQLNKELTRVEDVILDAMNKADDYRNICNYFLGE